MHIWIAKSIVFWSFVHVIAQYINFQNIAMLLAISPAQLSYGTPTGVTGLILCLCLFLMVTSSSIATRHNSREIFSVTHNLAFLFFFVICIHGSFCFIQSDEGLPNKCRGGPQTWKWVTSSLFLYLLDLLLRAWNRRMIVTITKVIEHKSKVVELQMELPVGGNNKFKYLYICCPEISGYQWHPFTITSAPHDKYLSVHIRVVGDWTTSFSNRLGCNWDGLVKSTITNLPKIWIDSGYGSSAENVFRFSNAVLIGAGIGITPFAAILKSIQHRINMASPHEKLKKVTLYWICRDQHAFEWFHELFTEVESSTFAQFLEINIFVTQKFNSDEINNIAYTNGHFDTVTGLTRTQTRYGRPNWCEEFKNLKERNRGVDVGVFYCGPASLSNILHQYCREWSDTPGFTSVLKPTRFVYCKETF